MSTDDSEKTLRSTYDKLSEKYADSLPVTLVDYQKKFLFGLISITVCIEDRKAKDLARNYKHLITFKVLWKRFSIIIRSPSFGYYKMDGVDINYMS